MPLYGVANRMGLQLKKGCAWWYADIKRPDGKRTVINLNIPIKGKPPASWRVADKGNPDFERSRRSAAAKLDGLRKDCAGARATKRDALHQYVSATGVKPNIPALNTLITAKRASDRGHPCLLKKEFYGIL